MIISDPQTKNMDIQWANRISSILKNHKDQNGFQLIQKEIESYTNRKIFLTILGLHKRGKSTLCNIFLNRTDDILAPIDKHSATNVISKFVKDNAKNHAEVTYFNGEKQQIPYEDIRKYVTEELNPENKKQVEEVTVFGNFEMDDDVVMVDLPGEDSLHSYHAIVLKKYIPVSDVIIFLSSAADPIKQNEINFLMRINKDSFKKVFFVINKKDLVDPDELNDALQHNYQILKSSGIPIDNKIYTITTKKGFDGDLENSGIKELINDIHSFLKQNKLNLLRNSFLRNVYEPACYLEKNLYFELDNHSKSVEVLENDLEIYQKSCIEIKKVANNNIQEFQTSWNEMLNNYEAELDKIESVVQKKIECLLQETLAFSINQKLIDELPEKFTKIIENEMKKNNDLLEEEAHACIAKMESQFPSIHKFFSDKEYRLNYEKINGSMFPNLAIGSVGVLTGGAIIGMSTSMGTLGAGIPYIGWIISTPMTVFAAPLVALGGLILLGGSTLIAIPSYNWIKRKHRQKNDLIDDAKISIKNAFIKMRKRDLPYLRDEGKKIIQYYENKNDGECSLIENKIKQVIESKKNQENQQDRIDLIKNDLEILRDLLSVCEKDKPSYEISPIGNL